MSESQGLLTARTEELRDCARRYAEVGRSVESAGRLTIQSDAVHGTVLQAAIEYAQQRIHESLTEIAKPVDATGSAMVRSADNYDDGDRAFAASMIDPTGIGP
jgi:hypothetical protein